jgi:tetratricopeptide (TPR) repeat protein
MLTLVLALLAHAEVPLPDYREEVAVRRWYEVNDMIERSCLDVTCSQVDTEILGRAIDLADDFQDRLFRDARLEYLTGLAWRLKGDDGRAQRRFESAVRLDDTRQDAWHDLGEVRLARGKFAAADEAFGKVTELVSDGNKAWIGPWRQAEVAAHRQDPATFEKHMKLALKRGFSFRQIRGLPNWQQFYADPIMRDPIRKLVTVYGEPSVLESLETRE